jgi:hypothetical protein
VLLTKVSHDWGFNAAVSIKRHSKTDTYDRLLVAGIRLALSGRTDPKPPFIRMASYLAMQSSYPKPGRAGPEASGQAFDGQDVSESYHLLGLIVLTFEFGEIGESIAIHAVVHARSLLVVHAAEASAERAALVDFKVSPLAHTHVLSKR